jgi:hypothetical protein
VAPHEKCHLHSNPAKFTELQNETKGEGKGKKEGKMKRRDN